MKQLKILWAIDAFDDLKEIQEKQTQLLKSFSHHVTLKVDPVYILSPVGIGLSGELSDEGVAPYLKAAKKALAQKVSEGISIPMGEPIVLVQHHSSLRKSAEMLSKYAKSEHYDFILCGSHGRRGFQRMLMGSFAEELQVRSEVSVLVVGSHADQKPTSPLKILVANDLSDVNSDFFPEILHTAKALKAEITLLNVVPKPVEHVIQSEVYLLSGGWVPVPLYLEKDRLKREALAQAILDQAKVAQVPCRFVLDAESGSVTDSVLKRARDGHFAFIAMAAQSGPLQSSILGSITRQVMRSATCPVWVLRKAH